MKDALAAAQDDERQYAATIEREENETPTADFDAHLPTPDVIGTCEECGEPLSAVDEGTEIDEAGMWCRDCRTQPMSGPAGIVAHDDTNGVLNDEPHGDGVSDPHTPREDCADPDCAVAARNAVETRGTARVRIIAEDRSETRAVLDVPQGKAMFRHLGIPGLRVTVCMKTRPTSFMRRGSLDSVDCLDCLDEYVRLVSRP